MGAHLLDHAYWGLDPGFPTIIETVSTPFNKACFPMATKTYYEFPAKAGKPPLKMIWYDGGLMPSRPEEIGDTPLNGEGGAVLIGSKGKLVYDTYGRNSRLFPKPLQDSMANLPQKLSRIKVSHEQNWADAAKGKNEPSCPFEYAARLTEVMLLGIVSLRAGTKIHYDAEAMRVTNPTSANEFLRRDYRHGWTL
jgi:hypothetical protein